MTSIRRWAVVVALLVLVAAVPVVVRAWPAADEEISVADLLTRVEASNDAGWSGYVQTQGTLQLPAADQFTGLTALFGEQTRLRAWWRGPQQWRVDRLLPTGEEDLIHNDQVQVRGRQSQSDATNGFTIAWSFEGASANLSRDPDIRLPRTADLLPPVLGLRVLEDVGPGDVERLPARRIAGQDALGLRVVPASAQSSIDHVDLWADRVSGVPLSVEVFDADLAQPVFTSAFGEFSGARPAVEQTSFSSPPGSTLKYDDVLDIADAANQYAPVIAPPSLAGLPKSATADRAVGVYGTGVTQVIAIPLRGREAGAVREQLTAIPDVRLVEQGTVASVGPLGVLVTGAGSEDGWLVAGTVTEATLLDGASDIETGITFVGGR